MDISSAHGSAPAELGPVRNYPAAAVPDDHDALLALLRVRGMFNEKLYNPCIIAISVSIDCAAFCTVPCPSLVFNA